MLPESVHPHSGLDELGQVVLGSFDSLDRAVWALIEYLKERGCSDEVTDSLICARESRDFILMRFIFLTLLPVSADIQQYYSDRSPKHRYDHFIYHLSQSVLDYLKGRLFDTRRIVLCNSYHCNSIVLFVAHSVALYRSS